MSIRSIIAGDGVGLYNNQRDIPNAQPPIYNYVSSAWTRPSDWPALPTLTNTSQEFAGLIAITNDNDNYVALTLTTSSGTYSVNWGDGTTVTGIASGTSVQHQYNYSTYSGSVLSEGYKAAVVTATPDTGNLTGINLQVKATISAPFQPLATYVNAKWLDISLGSPYLTTLSLGAITLTVGLGMLQQVQIWSGSTILGNSLFAQCFALQSVPTLNLPNVSTPNFQNMFLQCVNLKICPTFPTFTNSANASNMFQNCYSLETVTTAALSGIIVNTTSSMFLNCSSLKEAPLLNGTSNVTATSMFSGCNTLISVPRYSFAFNLMDSMFQNCYSLKSVPLFNTASVTTMNSMFTGCESLVTVPLFNTILVTNTSSMFQNCYSLTSVPGFNLPVCTTFATMFQNCYRLTSVGQFTTSSSLLTTNAAFQSCSALVALPLFNTQSVTDMSNMFNGCYSLVTIPTFNTQSVTTMSAMFNTCYSLSSVPTLNTINVTNMTSMFASCKSLVICPAFNTSNVTNMTSMFNTAQSLQDVQFTNTSKVTNMTSMFNTAQSFSSSSTWSSWDTGNVANTNNMFNGCTTLPTIPAFNTGNVTNIATMFQSCSSLNGIPALNLSNVNSTTNMFTNANSLSRIQSTNLSISTSIASTNMTQLALQEVFTNTLAINATSQTITITSCPGADTPKTFTGTASANSNVITMANTVGLATGMIMTVGNGFGIGNRACTLNGANSVIVLTTGQAPANGMPLSIATPPGTVSGYAQYLPYYVVNSGVAAANAFQISSSNGGGAVTLIGTTLSGNVIFSTYINTVNANVNILVSNPSNAAFTSNSYTFRNLNVSQAVLKNWTVTG